MTTITLKDEFVIFHLSAEGRDELADFFPGRKSVSGLVVDVNELGIWVWLTTQKAEGRPTEDDNGQRLVPVFLLKRQYFSTAEFDMDPNSSRGTQQIVLELG